MIINIKSSKVRIALITVIAVVIALSGFFIIKNCIGSKNQAGKYETLAKTNDNRIDFLSQFGWEANSEPIEIKEVVIPEKFNSTYEKYNDIQKKQGMDLSKYRGKSCTRYTYQVINYKDAPGGIRANILVYKDKVIGGDICSVELGGFMHGFFAPEQDESEETYNITSTRDVMSKNESYLDEPLRTTYRSSLEPDQKMPNAPVD